MSTAAPTTGPSIYPVAAPRGVCSVTQQPIAPEEPFFAALRETPEGFERLDVRLDAWDAFDRAGVVAFWRTKMPAAGKTRKPLFVDDTVLCDLIEKLADVEAPEKIAFRFVLALVLMRKKLLVCESIRHEERGDVWTVRLRGREDRFDLIDPKPTEEQIASIREQLDQILSEQAS